MKRIRDIEWKTWIKIIVLLILAPGVIRGLYFVGYEVGRALAIWFG